jgi:EmrB/QacA subfamily drug resistance transporter
MSRTGIAGRPGAVTQYALLAGPLLSMIDSSIVNVAAEPIARELHTSLGTVQWTVSGYLLALGTGLAGTAWLARRYGTRPVYRASLAAFTVASAMCALSPGIAALIGLRVLQGLVAAPLVPLAMSMMLGKSGSARSISPAAGILLFAAPAFGPTVGGALIGAAGWRLIFAVNVPFGLLACWAVKRLPPGVSAARSGERTEFDFFGLVMLAAGVTLVLLGTSQGGADGWSAAACWAPLAAGAALLAVYGQWAAGRPQPALDLSLAREPVGALSMGLCALAAVVTWAAVFLLPVFVQSVQGRSALAAGLALAPQGLITGLSTALGQRVLTRFTVRATVCLGFVVLGVASLGLLLVGAGTALWLISLILAARSASVGLVITPLLAALTGPLPPERMGDASTLFNVVERIAASFGIGLLASLYAVLARSGSGPVAALHVTGVVVGCIAGLGAVGATALPAIRNTSVLEA